MGYAAIKDFIDDWGISYHFDMYKGWQSEDNKENCVKQLNQLLEKYGDELKENCKNVWANDDWYTTSIDSAPKPETGL